MEPEDMIGKALYLLQLCQQDLNMGRKTTVLARARKAKQLCAELEEWAFCNRVGSIVDSFECDR